ncbi:MAG TPA: helix-turn-helix domain-containing protein [Pyrinomonadaceae bacterium]
MTERKNGKSTLGQLPHSPSHRLVKPLMTPEECAAFLHIEVNTLYVMKAQKRIPYRKVGHLLRFDFEEIVQWTKREEEGLA